MLLSEIDLWRGKDDLYVVDLLILWLSIIADLKTFSVWLELVFSILLSLSEEVPLSFLLLLMNAADDTHCGAENGVVTKDKSSPSGDSWVESLVGDSVG